jgi:hypothetical protein
LNNTGQIQIINVIVAAILSAFMYYIYLVTTAPVIENLLIPFLDSASGTAMGNPVIVKTLFQLIPLVLVFVIIQYLITALQRPPEQYPPAY